MSEELIVTLGVRVTAEDNERIDGVAAKLPLSRRMDVCRAALRLGLAALESNPELAVDAGKSRNDGPPTRPSRKTRTP